MDVVPVEEAGQKKKRLEFQTEAQVVRFVNNIYCIEDQGNIKGFSSLFENKTLLSFAHWCSTNKVSFLKPKDKNPSIKKVVIETFAVSNEVFIYDSSTLLSDVKLLEKVGCRPKPVQRSK
ncbi:hypothetical protein F4703DRAFT_1914351 [Phycomyces blakesleeanus]